MVYTFSYGKNMATRYGIDFTGPFDSYMNFLQTSETTFDESGQCTLVRELFLRIRLILTCTVYGSKFNEAIYIRYLLQVALLLLFKFDANRKIAKKIEYK